MSSLSHLKGVRTRYRNTLLTEIQIGAGIISSDVQPSEEQEFVLKATKCAEKLKLYVDKLEFQSGKVSSALEEQSVDIDSVIEEDCNLCSKAMDCYLDLNQFKERLIEFIKMEKEKGEVKQSDLTSEIVDLQKEMKDILKFQIEQKEKENSKKNEESISVKLPKLDLI